VGGYCRGRVVAGRKTRVDGGTMSSHGSSQHVHVGVRDDEETRSSGSVTCWLSRAAPRREHYEKVIVPVIEKKLCFALGSVAASM
jgi:hypothetical protein